MDTSQTGFLNSDHVSGRLGELRRHFGIPGISASVILGGRRDGTSVGVVSSREPRSMTDSDRLPISCAIKPIVSLICLVGHQTGLLSLNQDIAHILPELLGAGERATGISLRHLLSHTAGYVEPQEPDARWRYSWGRLVEFFPKRKQVMPPGAIWSYCHTGYVIAGKMAERAFGKPLEVLLNEIVCGPLGIELRPLEPHDSVSLHVKSPRSGAYEPMRPPVESGFLRHSISDMGLSSAQLATLGSFFAGGFAERLPELEPARKSLFSIAATLPTFVGGSEREGMPVAYCHGVADFGGVFGVNGSYVGSTCAIRFSPTKGAATAVTINAWAPFVRDIVIRQLSYPFTAKVLPRTGRGSEPDFNLGEVEGRYEALMLGGGAVTIVQQGQGISCTIERLGIPPQNLFLAKNEQGQFEFVTGAREAGLAFMRHPETRAPIIMLGASAAFRAN